MELNGTVAFSAILVMGSVGLFSAALPLGLALAFRRRTGGRKRFFLLGCAVFPLFALGLEAQVHRLLYYGVWSQALTSSVWLYALYGGLMAGIFEECGRWAAFRLGRRWTRGPGDALMYGAGHGGAEAFLLLGMTMVNNLILALAFNRGGLPAVEAWMGPVPEAGMAAVAALTATPAALYLWGAFERVTAVAVQIALSVLVYAAVNRRGGWYWFPAAILLHAAVDVTAVAAGAFLPIPATEALLAAWAAALVLLARRVYLREKREKDLTFPQVEGVE